MNEKTYRVESVYKLLQPLSHIGETESTQTKLNTIRVMNGGKPCEVFAYTGNALRGQWRDSGAIYLLERLNTSVPKKAFNLLFSGGSIGGDQSIDIDQAKTLRSALPFVSLFGGGVGNQILSGKITQSFAFPVCEETSDIIPPGVSGINYDALETSWRRMTGVVEFTRKDDSKDVLGDKYIKLENEQMNLMGEIGKKAKKDDGPATQMRYGVQYLLPGVQLWHMMHITCQEVELGAFVASVHQWAKKPFLGGMSGKGFGLVDLSMSIVDEEGARVPFISVRDGVLTLADLAKSAKEQYDEQLKAVYNQALDGGRDKIVALMEGK